MALNASRSVGEHFQLAKWWEGSLPGDYDVNSITIVPDYRSREHGDDNPGSDLIVVGDQGGHLIILDPSASTVDTGSEKHGTVMIDVELGIPALQIEFGPFMCMSRKTAEDNEVLPFNYSERSKNVLAILHPQSFAIYDLKLNAESGKSKLAKKVYEASIQHLCSNFAYASPNNSDCGVVVCVQSLDGVLTVLSGDGKSVGSHVIPDAAPGGPICCVHTGNELLVLLSSNDMQIRAYRLRDLIRSGVEAQSEAESKEPVWEYIIGTPINQMVVRQSDVREDVIVGAGSAVYILTSNGDALCEILLSARVQSLALCDRFRGQDPRTDTCFVIGTSDDRLLVHDGVYTHFSCPNPLRESIALKIGQFGGIPGLITALDARGNMIVGYLAARSISDRDLAVIDVEQPIDASTLSADNVVPQNLRLEYNIRKYSGQAEDEHTDLMNDNVPISPGWVVDLTLSNLSCCRATTLIVSLKLAEGIQTSRDYWSLTPREDAEFETLRFGVYVKPKSIPSTMEIRAHALHQSKSGSWGSDFIDIILPLATIGTFAKPAPLHGNACSMVLEMLPDAIPLGRVYSDVIDAELLSQLTTDEIGFKYDKPSATVNIGLCGSEYTLRSEGALSLLALPLQDLVERLDVLSRSKSGVRARLVSKSELPLELFESLVNDFLQAKAHLSNTVSIMDTSMKEVTESFESCFGDRSSVSGMGRSPDLVGDISTLLSMVLNQCDECDLEKAQVREKFHEVLLCSKIIELLLSTKIVNNRWSRLPGALLATESFAYITHNDIDSPLVSPALDGSVTPAGWAEVARLAHVWALRSRSAGKQVNYEGEPSSGNKLSKCLLNLAERLRKAGSFNQA
ncbi:PTHB1 N-terminus-domain-containing protein [Cladochytrium replicatum]|nr:PTHB1 N-terminus-domain-containing protein [Cladochytrium replicatum]